MTEYTRPLIYGQPSKLVKGHTKYPQHEDRMTHNDFLARLFVRLRRTPHASVWDLWSLTSEAAKELAQNQTQNWS